MLVKKEKTKVMEVLLEQDRPEKFEDRREQVAGDIFPVANLEH